MFLLIKATTISYFLGNATKMPPNGAPDATINTTLSVPFVPF